MRYTGSLVKKEREEIFRLFLDEYKLKFSAIEKKVKIRSNMLAYHLEQLQREGLLQKQGEHYALTQEGQRYIPILSHVTGTRQGALPIVLIAPVRRDKILFLQRDRRPYKDRWGFIGGKIELTETLEEAVARKLAEHGVVAEFDRLCAITQELIEEDGKVKHNFLLFLVKVNVVSVKENNRLRFFTKRDTRKAKVIPSDLYLLGKLGERVDIRKISVHEQDGELSNVRIQ